MAVPVAVLATGGSAPPSARVLRWREDIAYLASELPQVRADGLGPVSRAAWDSAASRLEAAVPQLTDGQLLVGLARMVAMLHDYETYLEFPAGPFFPLDAQWFGRGLFLLAVPAADRALLGAQVLAVDGQPVAQVMDRISLTCGTTSAVTRGRSGRCSTTSRPTRSSIARAGSSGWSTSSPTPRPGTTQSPCRRSTYC